MNHFRPGFTLLEILVVIAFVGLVSTGGYFGSKQQIKKVHDAKRKTDVHELQVALEAYRVDHQSYPSSLPVPGQPLTSSDGQTIYLYRLPSDPVNKDPYLLTYWATPSALPETYIVCAYRLETGSGSFCLTNRQ